jgi:ribosomal-protein-alanine N-acetyltransferase
MRNCILTERLILRDMTLEDAEFLMELDADPEVMRYIGTPPPPELHSYRERVRDVYLPWQIHPWYGVWIVAARDNNNGVERPLGWTFIRPANAARFAREVGWDHPEEVEVGYRFCRSAWGSGIATESTAPLVSLALADSAVTAIVACAHVDNLASQRVLLKLGLQPLDTRKLSEPHVSVVRFALQK